MSRDLATLLELTSPQARAQAAQRTVLPVLPELAELLPDGGLLPGTVTEVHDAGLLLALAAGPSASDSNSWAAVVGWPEIGLAAAAGYGLDLRRLLIVDDPGEAWPEIVATLMAAVDLVILQPSTPPPPALASRLTARLRGHRCAVLTMGHWPGSVLRLDVTAREWSGLGDGHGMLQSRRVTVRTSGRGRAATGRTAELLLPDEHGQVALLTGETARMPVGDTARAV